MLSDIDRRRVEVDALRALTVSGMLKIGWCGSG